MTHSDGRGGDRFVFSYLPYLLAQAAERMSYRFHVALKEGGIRETEWRVLASLHGAEPMSLGTLERFVLAPQSTLSRTVERLTRRGLLERSADADDRRVVKIGLSPHGRATAGRLIEAAVRFQEQDLAHLGDADLEKLRAMLASLFPAPDAGEDQGL